MPEIKETRLIAEKWGRVTPPRVVDYKLGVQNPRRSWEDATIAAVNAWELGIAEAIADRRFEGGVRRAGDQKWREKTLEKGPSRWSQGVAVSEDDYARGFQPYRDLIASIVLPPRGPKGSPQNIERVRILADAMHALKVQLMRGG